MIDNGFLSRPKENEMKITLGSVFSMKTRIALAGLLFVPGLFIIAGACMVPFYFESSSMFYKFGIDKALLRGGKIVGMLAVVLLMLQMLLASRSRILDRIFSLNRIYAFHRINGITIAILASVHPILILAADNFAFFPLEKRYWPEFLGIALLMVLLCIVIVSNWRQNLGIAYDRWLPLHRVAALTAMAAVFLHVLYVSETYETGTPRMLLLIAAILTLLLAIRLGCRRFFKWGKNRFLITGVRRAGKAAFAVDMRLCNGQDFVYMPGQFAFVTPQTPNLAAEEHPFTLSSTPSQPATLQITVRQSGDWTDGIRHLKSGDRMTVDGPYGLFTHLLIPANDSIVMIAGGIGITPMLSMLRFMADRGEQRKVLLIWSNRTVEYMVFRKEIDGLKNHLAGLRVLPIFTRGKDGNDPNHRLDQAALKRVLEGWSRRSGVFICGPPAMSKTISSAVKKIGFNRFNIFTERFQV